MLIKKKIEKNIEKNQWGGDVIFAIGIAKVRYTWTYKELN